MRPRGREEGIPACLQPGSQPVPKNRDVLRVASRCLRSRCLWRRLNLYIAIMKNVDHTFLADGNYPFRCLCERQSHCRLPLVHFTAWIEHTDFSTWIRESPSLLAFPTFLIIH